ncbi:hypothetical protein COCSUDRAFT_32546 [Coccomyxa subellipsoidea C-169]|uniref:Uncharacterized protein n=1 Tax=Coccomyxa subellipsoidea (strain C-169) TaxID=574566 RepID=I0Z335_COCSC|nr:hypothetical protein COCSUDRAFT_32546 [Coccomyxa subellipsoidea C-169]EIE25054.1 hypothetical protein COCSUDRAFT_32546 [Coccomyxa subellipsoidea C-169]|eukprot:XP_005649598.1 hypothetical protein COCSUDRAFT_32546 [Coccomyxa subellipsoidea C-169]
MEPATIHSFPGSSEVQLLNTNISDTCIWKTQLNIHRRSCYTSARSGNTSPNVCTSPAHGTSYNHSNFRL